ncbi:aldo/keto reductase [Pseudogemmobacter sonorensis]|uniref:aldo/keto reductase n=1 Tax=Pseudogemmobacter sonorensis TaxID=2989681 RepID=UPI0036AD3A6E
MHQRQLGRSGIAISPLVFGGNVFGWTADRARSFDLLDRFLGAGFETVDTADVYSAWVPGNAGGESETIIGDWMAARGNRDAVTIVTKVGMEMGPEEKGLSATWIERAAEASLRRLKTDRIDLYLSHLHDESVPYEETLSAYDRLIRAGKVRAIGASNHSAEQLRAALDVSSATGLPRYEVLQPEFNLHNRAGYEGALSDLARAEGISTITYYSLASGFLTGKYRSAADLGQSPRGAGIKAYLTPRGLRILDALEAVAGAHGAKPAEVALAWLIARPDVTAPIASATSTEQLDSLIRATTLQLGAEDIAALDQASRA